MKFPCLLTTCLLAALVALTVGTPRASALTVSFHNANAADVPNDEVWIMFGGANNGTLSGTLTYSSTPQAITFGTTYQLSEIANQEVEITAGESAKIFILYSKTGTEFAGSNGNPAYNYGQSAASVNARWDKVEYSQFSSASPSSGFNMSAADFFSIPLSIETRLSGAQVAVSDWHPRTPTATVLQNLSAFIATGPTQPYAIVQPTSGKGYSVPVTVSGATLDILRIVNPQQVPLTVVGTNNPLPNPYVSFTPYIQFIASSGNITTLEGTYGGVNTGATPVPNSTYPLTPSAYVTQDYLFTSTISASGDLVITGSGVANINTGSGTPVGNQTIRVAAAELAQGIYTAAPPYTIDSFQGGTVTTNGSNSVYDQVISDLLAGFNLGLVGSTVVDPRLTGTLNNIPAGTKLGTETSAAWFSNGPLYGLNPKLSADQAFATAQPTKTFYNEYAQYVSSVTDAYSFPYTDKTAAPFLDTTPGVADTLVINILPDSATVSGLLSPPPFKLGKPVRFFGNTNSSLRVRGQPRMPYSEIKLYLQIDHPQLGDLVVRLHAPWGETFLLHNKTGGDGDDLILAGVPLPSDKVGRTSGIWRLSIDDTKRKNNGELVDWGLEFPATD